MTTKVHLVGSHGLYASYGGWDQLVINLAELKSSQIQYLIFNPKETPVRDHSLENVSVKEIPLSGAGIQGLLFDAVSVLMSFKADTLLMLGMKALPVASFLKLVRPRLRLVVNIGGVEWERPQFNKILKLYLRLCFYLAKKNADCLIIDNEYYREFLSVNDSVEVQRIAYGGTIDKHHSSADLRSEFEFIEQEYYLSISRSISDNKIDELCSVFSKLPDEKLVMISNFSNSQYGRDILERFKGFSNIVMIDGLYDKPKLDAIRRSCRAYIHTHTLCGSSPSLIEMIVCRVPIYSIDVVQNRFTLDGQATFFKDFDELTPLLATNSLPRVPGRELVDRYNWPNVVSSYENLLLTQ